MRTYQPFAHRKLFTRRDTDSLQDVLLNRRGIPQRAVFDLDGSLHQGICESLLRGITNADLALLLAFQIPLSQIPSYIEENIKIFLYDRKTLANGVSVEEREMHTRYLIDRFHTALQDVPQEAVQRAAGQLPRFQYSYAQKAIQKIQAKPAIISCAVQSAVEAYGKAFSIDDCFGNPLWPSEKRQSNPHIYGAEDKERLALSLFLEDDSHRAIAVGDTADDLGLARAAKKLSKESVVIAIHGRSEALEAEADIIASSWGDILALLEQN